MFVRGVLAGLGIARQWVTAVPMPWASRRVAGLVAGGLVILAGGVAGLRARRRGRGPIEHGRPACRCGYASPALPLLDSVDLRDLGAFAYF